MQVIDVFGTTPVHLACELGDEGVLIAQALIGAIIKCQGSVTAARLLTRNKISPARYKYNGVKYCELVQCNLTSQNCAGDVESDPNHNSLFANNLLTTTSNENSSAFGETRNQDVTVVSDDEDLQWLDYEISSTFRNSFKIHSGSAGIANTFGIDREQQSNHPKNKFENSQTLNKSKYQSSANIDTISVKNKFNLTPDKKNNTNDGDPILPHETSTSPMDIALRLHHNLIHKTAQTGVRKSELFLFEPV